MKTKILNLFFSFSSLLLVSLSPGLLFSQSIYVDDSNNTGNEDGTEQHPYNTIKEGINAAVPGTTVMIKEGNYIPDESWSGNEHTLFLKAGVGLFGEGYSSTIIEGIVVDQEESNLSISLEGLNFQEFHFVRGTHAGPFDTPNIIRNCAAQYLNFPFGAGIPVNDSTPGPNYGFLIEHNVIGTDGSIEFKQGSGVSEIKVLNNTAGWIFIKSGGGYTYVIDNNNVQYGIEDNSGVNITTISNNTIWNGAIIDRSGGNQYGIEDEIIENNVIYSNESSPIFVDEDYPAAIKASSRSITIRNNTISCTANVSGIRSSAGAPMHIVSNDITLAEVTVPNPDPYEGVVGILNYSGWGYVTGNKIYGGQMGYYSKAATVLFADNVIDKAYTGFFSMGAEEVRHNTIKNCNGDGMILNGLKGPIHNNMIKDNAGSGILVLRSAIDLGGGNDTCPGNNIITGNGNFDLYIKATSSLSPTLYARYNVWDHTDPADISQYDIRDATDSTGLVEVDFTPISYLDIPENIENISITIFPNPVTRNSLTIRCETGLREVTLINSLGQFIKKWSFDHEKEVMVDVTGIKEGVYWISVLDGSGQWQIQKFIGH
jgi:hypothetical protein